MHVSRFRSPEFDDEKKSSCSSDDMDEYGSDADLAELSLSPPSPSKRAAGKDDAVGDVLGIQDYMELMDRELAGSKVGQSFEREPAVSR